MLSFSNTSATVNDDSVQLTDDADLPQELFPILKHNTLEEKEAEDLKGKELKPHFPYKFGMSANRHVIIYQDPAIVQKLSQYNINLRYNKHASYCLETDLFPNEGRNLCEKIKV